MKTLPQKIDDGTQADVVARPIYLVEIDLDTPLRLCSREEIDYNGNTFAHQGLAYRPGELRIYNENGQYTADFVSTRDDIGLTIWESYGEAPFVTDDWQVQFKGEIGRRRLGEWIVCSLKEVRTRPEPHTYLQAPTFNHLPPKGLEILTPTGIYRVE